MSKYVITVLDTTGIQPYIFNSNRLRENIGASYLVSQATDGWVKDKLEEIGVPKNRQYESIKDSQLKAALVYAGGGNSLLLFKSLDIAKEFTQKLSQYILNHASGINLVATHLEFDWDNDILYEKVKYLQEEELEKQKRSRIPSSPLLGLGVTASCKSTQLVAVNTSAGYIRTDEDEEEPYLISRETEAKLKVVASQYKEPANKTLREKFKDVLKGYQFSYRMDHFGRSKGESSYYAVIHADGNSMGERFKKYGEASSDNPDYVQRMRKLSESVDRAGLTAVKKVIEILVNSIDKEGKVMGQVPIFTQKENLYLPFRPLVYGGDDVTFVCDGRLGLELAAIFLKAFQEQTVADGQSLTACAGVSIVKSHYPFARAYALSEALCGNAKKFVREQKQQEGEDKNFSAIDWHIAASGLFGSISEIRQREYQVTEGDLTMRPVLIEGQDTNDLNQWRTWSNFTSVVNTFNEHEDWKGRRNKVIALREKLRESREAVKQFCEIYRIGKLPKITGGDELALQEKGWTEKHCGYFDPIEAMEFYLPLNKGESNDCVQTENEAAK